MEEILRSYERSEAQSKIEKEHLAQTRATNIVLQEQNRAAQHALEKVNQKCDKVLKENEMIKGQLSMLQKKEKSD